MTPMRSVDYLRLDHAKELLLGPVKVNDALKTVRSFSGHLIKNGIIHAVLMDLKTNSPPNDAKRQILLSQALSDWLSGPNSPVDHIFKETPSEGGASKNIQKSGVVGFVRQLIECEEHHSFMAVQAEAIAWTAKFKLLAEAVDKHQETKKKDTVSPNGGK